MLFNEMITVYCKDRNELINAPYQENEDFWF
jgi:hypothetical protein